MKGIKIVQLLVLISMLFNISHASLIAVVESCEHKHQILSFQSATTDNTQCDDLCDIHHLFHFSAIIISQVPTLIVNIKKNTPKTKHHAFLQHIKETTIKPPIV